MARKRTREREFICSGDLTLRGVTFFIKAASLEDAQQKAARGEWSDWEVQGAESSDWECDPNTVESND